METVNQGNTQATENPEKTFTQAEVDAIVGDRLKRDRQKYADYDALKEKADKFDQMEEASKSELQKAVEQAAALKNELDSIKAENMVRDIREKVANETGVPASLLTATTEDECTDQAKAILAYDSCTVGRFFTLFTWEASMILFLNSLKCKRKKKLKSF